MKNKSKRTERKQSWQYKRILEILDDYWLTEPDAIKQEEFLLSHEG